MTVRHSVHRYVARGLRLNIYGMELVYWSYYCFAFGSLKVSIFVSLFSFDLLCYVFLYQNIF